MGWENAAELTNTQDYHAIGKFLIKGQPTEPIPLSLFPIPEITRSYAERIKRRSKRERGRPRGVAEERIQKFLAPEPKPAKKPAKARAKRPLSGDPYDSNRSDPA